MLLSFSKAIWLAVWDISFWFCFCFGRSLNPCLCRLQLCLLAHASPPGCRVDPKQKKYSYDGVISIWQWIIMKLEPKVFFLLKDLNLSTLRTSSSRWWSTHLLLCSGNESCRKRWAQRCLPRIWSGVYSEQPSSWKDIQLQTPCSQQNGGEGPAGSVIPQACFITPIIKPFCVIKFLVINKRYCAL